MKISLKDQKLLWTLAAGRCNFPDCRLELIKEYSTSNDKSIIGEMAHIVGKSSTEFLLLSKI